MGRRRDVLHRRGSRRRLLQPLPGECRIVGTRRWAPGNTLPAVEAEYRALLAGVAAETGATIELDLKLVRGAYGIEAEHPLLLALQAAYREVTGQELEPVGIKVVADASDLRRGRHPDRVPRARSATVRTRTSSTSSVGELVRATRVYDAMLRRLLL